MAPAPPVEIAPDDPMFEHLHYATTAVDIETLDSPRLAGEPKRRATIQLTCLDEAMSVHDDEYQPLAAVNGEQAD